MPGRRPESGGASALFQPVVDNRRGHRSGVAQHLVTRFVDQRADDVLSSLPTKERPQARAKRTGQATAQPPGAEYPVPTVAA